MKTKVRNVTKSKPTSVMDGLFLMSTAYVLCCNPQKIHFLMFIGFNTFQITNMTVTPLSLERLFVKKKSLYTPDFANDNIQSTAWWHVEWKVSKNHKLSLQRGFVSALLMSS